MITFMQILMTLNYFPMNMTLSQVFAAKRDIFYPINVLCTAKPFAKNGYFEVSLYADGRRDVLAKLF